MNTDQLNTALAVAGGAAQRISHHLQENERPSLGELTALLDHINDNKIVLRGAIAYLAAQLHNERRTSDQAKAKDMSFVLHQIGEQVDWYRKQEETRK